MAELVREGKVRYLGLSEAKPGALAAANAVHLIRARWRPSISLCSAASRRPNLLDRCRELGIGPVA